MPTNLTETRASSKKSVRTSLNKRGKPLEPPKKVSHKPPKPQGPVQARPDLDIEHFRALLLAERARLEEERDQLRSRALDVDGALPEEGEGGDEDTADLASAMMDKEMDLSVEDEIEDLLVAVDHALQKIDDGTYGICDMSGAKIPPGRLELLPWASLTVECQALSESD